MLLVNKVKKIIYFFLLKKKTEKNSILIVMEIKKIVFLELFAVFKKMFVNSSFYSWKMKLFGSVIKKLMDWLGLINKMSV